MAEISANTHNRPGVAKAKKLSTRVDLTPMVDLGFLLITFFIFTTTMSQPNAVKLNLPDDSSILSTTAENKTLTLILDADDQLYYYKGFLKDSLQKSSYLPQHIRSVINNQMQQVAFMFGDPTQTTILIKPTKGASYKNIVDVLDEMLINGVTRYVLMDPAPAEELLLAANL